MIIIGGVVGVLICIILVGVAIKMCRNRRKKKAEAAQADGDVEGGKLSRGLGLNTSHGSIIGVDPEETRGNAVESLEKAAWEKSEASGSASEWNRSDPTLGPEAGKDSIPEVPTITICGSCGQRDGSCNCLHGERQDEQDPATDDSQENPVVLSSTPAQPPTIEAFQTTPDFFAFGLDDLKAAGVPASKMAEAVPSAQDISKDGSKDAKVEPASPAVGQAL